MSTQRSRDTRPERELRSLLHRRGLRFRVHRRPLKDLRRDADVVFTRSRVAVFVDGCFWHGCPEHASWPTANRRWWSEKIKANQVRDADTNRQLRAAGWTVIRVWEHEAPSAVAAKVEAAVRRGAPETA